MQCIYIFLNLLLNDKIQWNINRTTNYMLNKQSILSTNCIFLLGTRFFRIPKCCFEKACALSSFSFYGNHVQCIFKAECLSGIKSIISFSGPTYLNQFLFEILRLTLRVCYTLHHFWDTYFSLLFMNSNQQGKGQPSGEKRLL